MDKIISLESELKGNRNRLLKLKTDHPDYRTLLIQRSNLKDLLIEAYRIELIERKKDYDFSHDRDT